MNFLVTLIFLILFLWLVNRVFAFIAKWCEKASDVIEGNNSSSPTVTNPSDIKEKGGNKGIILFSIIGIAVVFLLLSNMPNLTSALAFLAFVIAAIYLFVKYDHRWKQDAHLFRGEKQVTDALVRESMTVLGSIFAFFMLFAGPGGFIFSLLVVLWIIFVVNKKEK